VECRFFAFFIFVAPIPRGRRPFSFLFFRPPSVCLLVREWFLLLFVLSVGRFHCVQVFSEFTSFFATIPLAANS
jgi:hypothetical protein